MKKLLETIWRDTIFLKFDLKMKLTTLFLLVTFLGVHANSYSQRTKISLNMDNVTINDVISEIESKTDFRFIYKIREVDTERKVSLNVNKERIEKILDILFSSNKNIDYKVINKQVILRKLDPQNKIENNNTTKAQNRKIRGLVKEENGLPIAGANVIIKGTTSGTSTDFDGNYELNVPNENSILVFSFVGFVSQEISVNGKETINVVLIQDSEALQEVVVQAYRNTTDKKNAAAISKIDAGLIENRPNVSVINTLQAKVPGLSVSSGSGQPGSSALVLIRGVGSINGAVQPLFIVDGVPVDSDDFRGINPNDIESVSVLKDAAASGAYGNRGANGVVIITTKSGKYSSGLEISYSESFGRTYQQKNNYDLMNSRDLLNLQQTLNIGVGGNLSDAEINVLANQNNTDWTDFIFQKGLSQNRQLAVNFGSENTSVYTSISHTDQEGIVKKTGIERYTIRSNVKGKSTDGKFNYQLNLTGASVKSDFTTNLGSGLVFFNPIVGALWGQPYLNPFRLDGTVNDDSFDEFQPLSASPYVILNNFRYNPNIENQVKSVANLKMSYEVLDGLTVGGSVGIDYQQEDEVRVISPESTNRLFSPQDGEVQGRQIENFRRDVGININGSINYNKTFGKHTLDASVFVENYDFRRKVFGFTQLGLDVKTFSPGDGSSFVDGNREENGNNLYIPDVRSFKGKAGLFSYFTIVDYDFDSKFGFTGTLRRDASFRFVSTNRWGTFYSISGRWNLDKENFLTSSTTISSLKLRASYGSTGNQSLGVDILDFASGSRTLYGVNTGYNNSTGLSLANVGNDQLKWETIFQTNIGLDYGLFNNRITGSIDVYEKKTNELFIPGPISAANGQYAINKNEGSLINTGIELFTEFNVISNDDLKVSIFGNVAFNKNEVTDLPQGNVDNGSTIIAEGNPIGSYYLVPYVGVNPANGNALYKTKDGGVTEIFSNEDRVIMDSALPKIQGGFGLNADYKGVYIQSNFSFISGSKRYNDLQRFFSNNPAQSLNFNVSSRYNNAWTPDNRITDQEGLFSLQSAFGSDKYLHDASYLRMRELAIGYRFSEAILRHLPITSCTVYVRGENLLTWSKWQGLDVEANFDRAFDFSNYPTPRIFTTGIDIKF